MNHAQQLRQAFGGKWDGDMPEIHGLVETGGKHLKIELLYVAAKELWQCCVFEDGACIALISRGTPLEAAADALASVRMV